MKTIAFHGIGSNSFLDQNTTSFSIETADNQWILVDCGPDIPRQIKKSGIALDHINTVILTHSHLDHCAGLCYFLFGRHLDVLGRQAEINGRTNNDTSLQIVAEPEISRVMLEVFKFCHPEVKLSYKIETIDIGDYTSSPLVVNCHSIRFVVVDHAVSTHGFRIDDSNGKSLSYSSDTLPSEAFIALAYESDVVIHEAMFPGDSMAGMKTKHSNAAQAGEIIRRINPKRKAFIVHIQPAFYKNRSQLEAQASQIAKIDVTYPSEGSKESI